MAGRGDLLDRIELHDGRVVEIRCSTGDDVDSLLGFFGRLDGDDLFCRFFSSQVPPRRVLERWLDTGDGALHLLVRVLAPGTDPELVGEAGYFPCDEHASEFAVTVTPRWRGWLGPYLLHLLVEQARARGVANLEADVLSTNSRMFALLQHRGYAVLDHEDSVVRVLVSTTGGVPTWPDDHRRPRILVEAPGGRWLAEPAARRAGFSLLGCRGPRCATTGCPALRGEVCPLVAGADALVFALREDEPDGPALLAAHLATRPDLPVLVPAGHRATEGLDPAPTVLPRDPAAAVAAVRDALGTDPPAAS